MSSFNTKQNEQALVDLRREWESVIDIMQSAQLKADVAQLEKWERKLKNLLREQQELAMAGKWTRGPEDLLSVIGHSRRETYHSAILAWLMDPLAPHGLGTRFLEEFLRTADPDAWPELPPDLHVYNVECEVTRGECRADIVVYADQLLLVVENKVDAAEGERQCDRIYDAFSDSSGARFVFLSPKGSKPRTATGTAAEEFRKLSYRQVIDALKRALGSSENQEPSTGRSTVIGYLHTLEEEFS